MFYVGLDLGKKMDFTAAAVVEREEQALAWMAPQYLGLRVRYLERMALGTPFPKVVERVHELVSHPSIAGRCQVVVDATGLGSPVVDELRRSRLPCPMTAVTITGGERSRGEGEWWHVPKQELLTGLHLLLENGEVRISKRMKERGALVKELVSMRASAGSKGNLGGEHDDLVMAVALGCWQARRRTEIGFGGQRLI